MRTYERAEVMAGGVFFWLVRGHISFMCEGKHARRCYQGGLMLKSAIRHA